MGIKKTRNKEKSGKTGKAVEERKSQIILLINKGKNEY